MFVLALVAGLTALLTVACGDKDNEANPTGPSAVGYNEANPTGASAVGGTAVTGGAVSLAAKADKVNVCHVTGNGSIDLINVNGNALPAHLGHGDHLPITSYADGDEDGFGDDASATSDCEPPAGNVLDGGDADDDDPTTYPGAPEVCGDGIDNNQDNEIDEDCTYANCAEIRAANPSAGDGDYTLFVGQAFDVYCQDMARTPMEYLTLVNTGPNTNFSQASAGGSGGGVSGVDDVRTNYTKVRLNPATLIVDTSDQTFSASTSTGQQRNGQTILTSMPYGTAYDCVRGNSETGIANVDLTGTPFSVASTFVTHGWIPAGSVNKTGADQVVNLTGGGNCGWMAGPDGGPFNQLGGSMQLAFRR